MKKTLLLITIILAIQTIVSPKVYGELSSPTLHSEAAILLEANSGKILFEKNAEKLMYPASVTKIATAIYAIENGDLEDIITVSSNASATNVEGTTVFLEEGEQVTLKKLIQGLLINSGNDAGIAIAEYLSGNVEQFSDDLNTYLTKVVGTEQTNFENPHGLFDENHVTTAKDLAKITKHAMKNERFRKIFGTKEMEWVGETWDTTLRTHHKLVKDEIPYEGITGGKNGFVSRAGYTLVTTAERDGLNLVVVTLKGSLDDEVYDDTIELLDYGFENFMTTSIEKGSIFTVDEEEYIAPEKLSYTYKPGAKLQEMVEQDGTLEIVSQNETIATFKLDKINKGNVQVENKIASGKTEGTISAKIFSILPYLSIVFGIGIVGIVIVWIRKKSMRSNRYFF
ncbi:D-alanyl-D-alanine carboxypeptidase family protein [Oceanobacillus rekensis]|uniref:D-alanyl-D-alanine carboxypeptidase family protein n=1 Tax=Oceanobacillus rekensis TaxID=937927 RepID=UPI000B431FEC|nr:D-alanyl-D-alanine carboxypeptidase family protein [Oceanobacillus rekensis]